MGSRLTSKLRILAVLAILAVALFSLKPVGEIRKEELMRSPHVVRLRNRLFRNITKAPVQKADLKVTSAVFDGIPVRVYRPSSGFYNSTKSLLPAVVFFHGGGWINGSVDYYDSFTRKIAASMKLLVISVEYRLAPKYKFPIPVEDCHKATMHVLKHASELGVNASKVILIGNSVGGNLAAVVSQRMKGVKPPLLAQILIYPVMQSLNFQLPSYNAKKGSAEWMIRMFLPYWTGSVTNFLLDAMVKGAHVSDHAHQLYSMFVDYRKLPEHFQKDYVAPPRAKTDLSAARVLEPFITNPDINPLMSTDMKGLPNTMVLTAGLDPLRDDGALYAVRLKEAGVSVRHMHYEGAAHGACCIPKDKSPNNVASRMNADMFKFIRSLLSDKKHSSQSVLR